MSSGAVTPRTRQRQERSEQLLAVAIDLFRRHGYHQVGMSDIAAGASMSGPALYRYFTGKGELLSRAVRSATDAYVAVEADHVPGSPVASAFPSLALMTVDRRDEIALSLRDHRYLGETQKAEGIRQAATSFVFWRTELCRERPGLTVEEAAVLVVGVYGVLGSTGRHRVRMPRARYAELLAQAAARVLHTRFPAPEQDFLPVLQPLQPAGSRLEAVTAEAARLFRERGYHGVSMEDIGAAAGVTAAALYKHTPSKAALLTDMFHSASDRLNTATREALVGVSDPLSALSRLAATRLGLVPHFSDLLAVYVTESENLSDRELGLLRRRQRDYASLWARFIMEMRPQEDTASARVLANCAINTIDEFANIADVTARPAFRNEAVEIVLRAMGVVPAPR
ncbi:TetR/AcrR family transcriptional regulator [Nocardiopsis ansamitocini]|uniref:TetR family transcriptional regulator n=1 Tax=Nocardiopsis ansamitocini TaxID=1670832 RepID=A0A9W6UIW5_9ACTN|nr:TetR/AcrR family transcriptional regulator [Nocardiopsis ansamitocini]GLU47868.1 TetR family transcriptional regulator [Nocardiopsis ansamitocini]